MSKSKFKTLDKVAWANRLFCPLNHGMAHWDISYRNRHKLWKLHNKCPNISEKFKDLSKKKKEKCCLKTLIIDLSTQFLIHLWHGPGLFWCWRRDWKPELYRSCVYKQCSTTIGSKQTFLTWSNCPIGTMYPKLMTTKGMSPLWPGGRKDSK